MKKWIAILLSVVLALGLCACTANKPAETTGTVGTSKTFVVKVVHQDGTEKEFTYTSAEEFVGPVLQAEGLIEGNAGPYGLEIHTVDGVKAVYAEGAYWAVYEGEEYAMQGIDETPIVDGAVYKLVYTLA